jgi:hypothetical protein
LYKKKQKSWYFLEMENNLVRDGGGGGVSGLDGLAGVVRDVGARPANDPLPGQTFAENVKSVN